MLDAEEAYQQYRDMVYGYLIRLCRDRDLAEELTQETFYQAMKNWKRYEGKSSVGTWLCAIARNQFLRIMRRCRSTTCRRRPSRISRRWSRNTVLP